MERFLKKLYKVCIPNRIRECKSVTKLRSMILGHDSIYTRSYYRDVVEDSAKESAVKISHRGEVIPTPKWRAPTIRGNLLGSPIDGRAFALPSVAHYGRATRVKPFAFGAFWPA